MTDDASNWFDQGGRNYARYRPDYPEALVDHLADRAPDTDLALDVGCGNGQFTRQLGRRFAAVVGSDPSADQIAHARSTPHVRYVVSPAEDLGGADHSAGLITAAQAAHWFDLPRFYAEVRRVAKPRAVLALISYGVAELEPAVNARFQDFYHREIGPFWPPERRMVDTGYATLDFPFRELEPPRLEIVRDWSAYDFLGYVATWSATRQAREAGQTHLLADFGRDLFDLWGDPETTRRIRWPLHMRLGEV